MTDNLEQNRAPGLDEAFAVWLKIGLLSFGGPAGQIALMHRILVEERRWIDEPRFLHALNYCMLLPGPEAQQLATYIGWLLNRTLGGLIAGVLFVLPGAVVILVLSIAYALFAQVPLVAAAFVGVKAAVLVVVVEAVLRIGKRALKTLPMYLLAAAAFVAIYLFEVPFPIIIAAASLVGLAGGMMRPDLFRAIAKGDKGGAHELSVVDAMAERGALSHTMPSYGRSAWLLLVFAVLWGGPIAALFYLFGGDNVFAQEAAFFSKLAVVTFGGAYAVLAYMAQQAVETYHWLTASEMLDGLGLAETTPGPLILVTQFVGFLGAYRQAVGIDPFLAGVLGSVVTVWVTFVPCFMWIFLGAPYIERLRENIHLSAALSGITAAVVGVILNLAVWFGLRVAFAEVGAVEVAWISLPIPSIGTANWVAILLTGVAAFTIFGLRLGVLHTLAICGGGAVLMHLFI